MTGFINFPTSASNGISWGSGPYSKLYDNGDLHIYTDDNLHFDTATKTDTVTILANGNVGIGTTGPAKVLDVRGKVYMGSGNDTTDPSNAQVTVSATTPTLKLINTGVMSSYITAGSSGLVFNTDTQNTIDFRTGAPSASTAPTTNGTSRLYINSSGNVGIGNTGPIFKLSTADGDTIATSVLRLQNGYLGSGAWGMELAGLDNGSNGHDLVIRGRNTSNGGFSEYFRVNSSGGVGIGTTGPAKLNIGESTGTTAGASQGTLILDHENSGGASSIVFRSKVNRASDYGYIQFQDASAVGGGGESNRLILGTGNDGDDHIALMPGGSVGIGTTDPGYKLDVSGNGRFTGALYGNSGVYTNDWFRVNGSGGIYWENHGGGWTMTDSSWMRTHNEKGVWTGAGTIANNYFDASNTVTVHRDLTVDNGYNVNVDYLWWWHSNSRSDRRLKKDIVPIDNALDRLMKLNGYFFHWKNDRGDPRNKKRQIGVIAQEVEKVLPEVVAENQNEKVDGENVKGVEYANIVPLLIESIKTVFNRLTAHETLSEATFKKLQSENSDLKAKSKELENKNKALEGRLDAIEKMLQGSRKPGSAPTSHSAK